MSVSLSRLPRFFKILLSTCIGPVFLYPFLSLAQIDFILCTITCNNFALIDFILCAKEWLPEAGQIESIRAAGLASHHFLVRGCMGGSLARLCRKQALHKHPRALKNHKTATAFVDAFVAVIPDSGDFPDGMQLDEAADQCLGAFKHAAAAALPEGLAWAQRPWISAKTLAFINQRNEAKAQHNEAEKRRLGGDIKKSVKADRAAWLDEVIKEKRWEEIRKLRRGKLRRGPSRRYGRLRDETGAMVDSNDRAECMARHLEQVQWATREVTTTARRDAIGDPMPVDQKPFTLPELRKAVNALRAGRAADPDGIPAEFWKLLFVEGSPAADWVLKFCN